MDEPTIACSSCKASIAAQTADYSEAGLPVCRECSQQVSYARAQHAGQEARISSESSWTLLPVFSMLFGLMLGGVYHFGRWSLLIGAVFFVAASFMLGGMIGMDTLDRSVAQRGKGRSFDLTTRAIARFAWRHYWSRKYK